MKQRITSNLLTCMIVFIIGMMASSLVARPFDVVVIDPGHGGADKGAHRYGVLEKDLNLKVAKKLEILLKAHKIKVVMTRRSDKTLSLQQRAEIANKYKNPIFVSIHFNATEKHLNYVKGVETFYTSSEGKRIASQVQKKMISKLRCHNRKIQDRSYKVLEHTKCPAILVECGFISNYVERQRCNRSWYQSLCASAIADGILAYKKQK